MFIYRSLDGGCFDPIRETMTVNAPCLSDRHCTRLIDTVCIPSLNRRVSKLTINTEVGQLIFLHSQHLVKEEEEPVNVKTTPSR